MAYIILTTTVLFFCFFVHQWHKKSKLNRFIRDVLQDYFRRKSLTHEHQGFLFHRLIESRYSTPDGIRYQKHVQSLWNDFLNAQEENPVPKTSKLDEKALLKQLLAIIGLVEDHEFMSLKEDKKNSLFNQVYSEFQAL